MITEEIEQQELDICRQTTIRLMKGTRYGSNRPAWAHAQDVAEAVSPYGWIHPEGWRFWVCVGWLHDILEDCEGVTDETLAHELVSSGVLPFRATELVCLVRILTKEKGETESYFQRIRDCGHWQLSLIKILDRIANLREGSRVFPRKRWIAYVDETKQHVVPLIANVDANLCERLMLELAYAMVDRPRGGRTR